MDPYLENPHTWRDLHETLIIYAREDLQPRLLPRYVARVEERVYLEPVEETRGPDLQVVALPLPPLLPSVGGGVAVAEPLTASLFAVAEPEWFAVPEREVHEAYIEIRDARGGEVVTVIEVLSPSNKSPGRGREEYLGKQEQLLQSDTNLVEIDLLRRGLHTVALPAAQVGPADYRVCIRKVVWPVRLGIIRFSVREPLRPIPIPLRPEDDDVALDLPGVFTRAYDVGAYAVIVDYTQEPDPPLSPEDAAWADELLRNCGRRAGEGKQG
jgi:hypothetical protein